ncbi:MAG TPA: PHP-associated domain-containing protein [Chloroflexota bacterium]|nr:PHP-associated domain-containing protein [Chloroflexota bacterium]
MEPVGVQGVDGRPLYPDVAPRPHHHPGTAWRDVDLHVHTRSSPDGCIEHRRLLDLARAQGRRVIAVTDHNTAAGAVAVRRLAAQTGDDLLVLVGMELSTRDLGHVVVFGRGVEEDWGWERMLPFPKHLPEHWVAIKAHPYRDKIARQDGRVVAPALPTLPERIDAVEVWNGVDRLKAPHLRQEYHDLSWAYAQRSAKVPVAASDAHIALCVHSHFTRFARPIRHVDDLVEQLRNGEAEPHAQPESHLRWCAAGYRRRKLALWHLTGEDWRARAAGGGWDLDGTAQQLASFTRVRALAMRGAGLPSIVEETGLPPYLAAEYLDVVDDVGLYLSRSS